MDLKLDRIVFTLTAICKAQVDRLITLLKAIEKKEKAWIEVAKPKPIIKKH